METVMQIIMFMLILELFELYMQKASTLKELISKLYVYYNQSVFIFFLVHPTFYFAFGVLLYFNAFNFFGITLLVFKVLDMFFKIGMIKQMYYERTIDPELEKMLNMEMTPAIRYMSIFSYLPLLYLAIFA